MSESIHYHPMSHMQRRRAGFTLAEIAIVLVIVGLLAGAILAGQAMMRAAELRAVITEYNNFVIAAHSFREKYFALPGDIGNATSFWGEAHATPATCKTTASTDIKTCNGNADGKINVAASSYESYRFWQQLVNADLLTGNYDGITHGTTDSSSTLENSPKSKMSGAVWFVWNWGAPQSGHASWFDGEYGSRFNLGGITPNAEPVGTIFTSEEAWGIDTKIDDGKPGKGKVMTQWPNAACNTATSSADTEASYTLTSVGTQCFLVFPNAF